MGARRDTESYRFGQGETAKLQGWTRMDRLTQEVTGLDEDIRKAIELGGRCRNC